MPPVRNLPVAASQTIKKYDLLELSSNKLAQLCSLPGSNNSVQASGGSSGEVFIALAPITTTGSVDEDDTLAVYSLNEIFVLMRGYAATASDAEKADFTIGTSYQPVRYRGDSANIWWYALGTTTTNGELKVMDKSKESAEGDDYTLLYVGQDL